MRIINKCICSIFAEMGRVKRIQARAINLIMTLTGAAFFGVGLYRMSVPDIKSGAAVILLCCYAQTLLWEDNYKNS